MPAVTNPEIDRFLREARIGVLCTNEPDGSPNGVPVWFEWDGGTVRVFSYGSHSKIARLENDPRASLVVARPAGEPEVWVAVDGTVSMSEEGVAPLVERLAARYWQDKDPVAAEAHARTLDAWRAAPDQFRVLTLVPARIRSSGF